MTSLRSYTLSLLQEDLINIYRWFCSKQTLVNTLKGQRDQVVGLMLNLIE